MRWSILAAAAEAVVSSVLAVPSFGDEVLFKNGDRISGTIETMDAGKMVIKTKVAGKITVDMKDVKTFSTDTPIAVRLKDSKTTVTQKVDTGPEGTVALAAGGALAPQPVDLGNVKSLNFKEDWTGNIVAGGALVRGNTESETLNIAIHMVRATEIDRMIVDAGFLYGRQRFETATGSKVSETQNDWFIGGEYDYYLSKQFYVYGNGRVERDTIAGISLRVTPGVGVGYDWFKSPNHNFHTEAGISWLYRDYSHVPPGQSSTEEAPAVRLAYHYDRKLNSKVLVFHDVEYFPGLDSITDYFFRANIGIRTALTDTDNKWFGEFKIQEEYDNKPAPGKGRNDTQFMLGVGYNF